VFSLDHLSDLRLAEFEQILPHLAAGAHVLEVGAGTGQQAKLLADRGFRVEAIDIRQSNYSADRVFDVIDYDGRTFPFADGAFDIVFSSNVLEHVPDLAQMHNEIARVLGPAGYAVHVMPTHSWRFWTTLSAFPAGLQHAAALTRDLGPRRPFDGAEARRLGKTVYAILWYLASGLLQRRHGERGNVLSETCLFRPAWWRRNFAESQFEIIRDAPLGIFHTGNMVLGRRMSTPVRATLARVIGSACHIYIVRPESA
jgi:SAM-dependent methyltransferase